MFYEFSQEIKEKKFSELSEGSLAAGYVTGSELLKIYKKLGFAESTADACQIANVVFRSGVETYDDYTFTELRIVDPDRGDDNDDCVALYLKKNMFIVVDVLDADRSTYNKFMRALNRFTPQSMTLEKLVYSFTDELLTKDASFIEKIEDRVSEMEESVLAGEIEEDLNSTLLQMKKKLHGIHNYYEQFLDILETLEANENDIFPTDTLMYISNLNKRIVRLREDIDSISGDVVHVQDAYSSHLDAKMNNTMKYLTVLTTIFFPLTIIVGWYGMNFHNMPELAWRYGYIYVIALSLAVIGVFVWIARKKWF